MITLTANAPETGKVFDAWVVTKGADKVTLADATKETTTFTMPDEEVEIQATYKNVLYTITMTDGEATVAGQPATTAIYQAEVTIKAATAPAGKTFDRWDVGFMENLRKKRGKNKNTGEPDETFSRKISEQEKPRRAAKQFGLCNATLCRKRSGQTVWPSTGKRKNRFCVRTFGDVYP